MKTHAVSSSDGSLTGPEQKIIDTLRSFEVLGKESVKRAHVAAMVGYSESTKSFKNALSSLRTAGLTDYRADSHVILTDAGRQLAAEPDEVLDQDALHAAWMTKLSGPERTMLQKLIDIRPGSITRAELAEHANYSESTKSFKNGLSHMRSLGLIDYGSDSTIFVTDLLFPFE